jgi:hypothetical protein
MNDDFEPGSMTAGEAAIAARALCRECFGSGERRVQRAAVLFSAHILGGTAIVPETCGYCDGEGWYDL